MRKEKEILEEALSLLVKELGEKKYELKENEGDGRLNSASSEDNVIRTLELIANNNEYFMNNNLTIGTPNLLSNNNREWYDFSIESKDTSIHNYFIPVNIKISNVENGAADNLSCKLGLFYALTGCLPKSVSVGQAVTWENYCRAVDKHMAHKKDKDYYFLVVNKEDKKDVFWNSLRCLNTLYPNGNNLPFQCKWNENRTQTKRTYLEARDFILKCFYESIRKRDTLGTAFDMYVKKYIGLKTDLVVAEDSLKKEGN